MTGPVRVQLSRAKGWKMPPNTVKVDRSTKWGNPDRAEVIGASQAVEAFRRRLGPTGTGLGPIRAILTADDVRAQLRGKNLACWCKVGAPCHADVLLELANVPDLSGSGEVGSADRQGEVLGRTIPLQKDQEHG